MDAPAPSPSPVLQPQAGVKDGQFVTPEGRPVAPEIDGVLVRPLVTQADQRGEVVELLSEGWSQALGEPIPHVYLATVLPGFIKGWVCHHGQHDRSAMLYGRLRWVLYDGRPDSPTAGLVQQVVSTERNRKLVVIPPGVWHALQNIGTHEAGFVNMATRAYDHAAPDKFRLPLDTPEIPFRF